MIKKRLQRFFITYIVVFVPLTLVLFQIELMQHYDDSYKLGGFILFYILGIYVLTTFSTVLSFVSIALLTEASEGFLYLAITYVPLLVILPIRCIKNQNIKLFFLIAIYLTIVILAPASSLVPVLIALAFGFTVYDYYFRQKKNRLFICKNGYRLRFIELMERNLVKATCLSVFPVPIFYYWVKKEIIWDAICKTEVVDKKHTEIKRGINESNYKK